MRYPQAFVDKVLEASNVVEIISQYTQLKHSGGGFMGRCPFPDHMEKTPSFSVSESKQVYHCFGCKKSGNVFSFLRDYNGMSFVEALEYLADRQGIPLPEPEDTDKADQAQQAHDKKKQILKLNKITADFYRELLRRASTDHPIKSYIKKRKLNPETIEEFQIGFATADWDLLANHLHKNHFSLPLAEEAKLVKARKEGNGYFDLFRDRLMFPILSPSGEVLAFGGRIHEQGEPKYLNSPESFVFSKSKVLYGLAHTAKFIRSEDSVVLVEGYMDLVTLFQNGLKNVAATMGTALTFEHAKLVKRMTSNVVVLFDGDEAGQMAAERSLTILLSQGLYPKGLILTEAKDPDEFINKFGLEALKDKIAKSQDLFSVVLKSWMDDYRGEASQKVKIADKLRPVFESIADNRLKNLYFDEVAQKLGVTQQWLKEAVVKVSSSSINQQRSYAVSPLNQSVDHQNGSVNSSESTSKKEKIMISNAPQVELILLQATLKSRANFEILLKICQTENLNHESHVGSVDSTSNQTSNYKQLLSQITHPGIRQILEKAEEYYRQNPSDFDKLFSLLIERVDKPEFLFSKDLVDETDLEKSEKFILDIVRKNQQIFLRQQSKKMILDVKQGMDEEKLKKFVELQKNRLSLKK